MFKCDMCGECCRNLDKSLLYADLDMGNGVCRYLNGNKCSIYDNRPLLCRIDESYETFFKDVITISEYYRLNYEACNILKNNLGGKK